MPREVTYSLFLFLGCCIAFIVDVTCVRAQPLSKDVCLGCHSVPSLEKSRDGKTISLHVDRKLFEQSIHGAFDCTTCHSDVSQIPHGAELKRVECSTCHADAFKDYTSSVHGQAAAKAVNDAATCASCHGSHNIQPAKNPQSQVYPLNLPRTCGACHGDAALAKRHGIPIANAYQLFMDSIHGRALTKSGLLVAANCSSCHGSHRIYPALDSKSSVHRNNVPNTCGQCHGGILNVFVGSAHGQAVKSGNPKAPVCTDCHTSHAIRRVEVEEWKLEIVRECGTCHVQSLKTYRDTFHGKVTALGFARTARCSDCHGSHDIRRVADPGSSVHPNRIVTTCGKCHAGSNASFVKYDPHADPTDRKRNPYLYYSARFMKWLIVGVFAFFGIHTVLWAGSAFLRKKRRAPPSAGNRRSSGPGEESQ
jgi:DnaJ-class molecular chaperone